MADLSETIESAAGKPAEAHGDAGGMKARPLTELIEADRYLKGEQALSGTNQNGGPKTGWAAVRIARAAPPGAP